MLFPIFFLHCHSLLSSYSFSVCLFYLFGFVSRHAWLERPHDSKMKLVFCISSRVNVSATDLRDCDLLFWGWESLPFLIFAVWATAGVKARSLSAASPWAGLIVRISNDCTLPCFVQLSHFLFFFFFSSWQESNQGGEYQTELKLSLFLRGSENRWGTEEWRVCGSVCPSEDKGNWENTTLLKLLWGIYNTRKVPLSWVHYPLLWRFVWVISRMDQKC